jgi:hypothetical protein
MSLRLNGSVLGKRNVPTATLATGAWSLRAQSLYRRDNIWPRRDPDAVAFAATSGATDIDAISDFVKGVKRLGLYNSMVCWPLRSSQNAGTGTTAYSLGGLGTFNGTLVNGPTWGANGVNFPDNGNSQILTGFVPPTTTDHVVFSAFQCNPLGTNNNAYASARAGFGGWTCAQNWNNAFETFLVGSPASSVVTIAPAVTDGSFRTTTVRFLTSAESKTVGLRIGKGIESISANLFTQTTYGQIALGNELNSTNRSLAGALAFCAYIQVPSVNNDGLVDLYKQTLGTGLGLP